MYKPGPKMHPPATTDAGSDSDEADTDDVGPDEVTPNKLRESVPTSDHDRGAPRGNLGKTRLEFQMGTRRVLAEGTCSSHHPSVAFLTILPGRLDPLLWFLRFLPTPLHAILQSRWPEWFLPPKIVLKRQKRDWEEEFDNEKAVYQQLAPLQGTVVPICYGEATCPATETTGTRALVLSHVDGIGLNEEAAGGLETERVQMMLMESLGALANLGVAHDDSKLDNYVLVGDRIMVIDFDSSYITASEYDPEMCAKADAEFATHLYWLAYGGNQPRMIT